MKKLLVISGILGLAGVAYVLRDRILATGLLLMEKANGLFVEDDEDDDQFLIERDEA